MSQPIVRAIDVGFGNTKFVALRNGSDLHCGLFPSIAPTASSTVDLSAGMFQRRNTVTVKVGEVMYEVGKDARLAQDATYVRVLDQSFPLSDGYLALIRGALHYMAVPHVDFLVVGLPMNNFDACRVQLAERLRGTHHIPAKDGSMRAVEVRNVRVLPQPIGALLDYSDKGEQFGAMKNQMNLVVDPGYYTLDWVVAHGVKVVPSRSDATPGGISAVLSAIGQAVERELGVQLNSYAAIDDALRFGTPARFFGKDFDLTPYLGLGKEKARQFVSALASKVGVPNDIDNILLSGGGASFFLEPLQERFPRHQIVVATEPVFSNVRGFQLAGERLSRHPTAAAVA